MAKEQPNHLTRLLQREHNRTYKQRKLRPYAEEIQKTFDNEAARYSRLMMMTFSRFKHFAKLLRYQDRAESGK
jgi:hypothetical protein